MAATRTRQTRKSRLVLEKLEGRSLLSGVPPLMGPDGILLTPREINAYLKRSQGTGAVPIGDRFISYITPQGGRVALFLHGDGSLKGTTVNPDGSLNLIYSGTNSGSAISANVQGGGGNALLATIRDAGAAPGDFSGKGSEPLSLVKLRNFTLISGGSINLTGGVGLLLLNSVDANSQIHVTATQAPSFTPLRSTTSSTTTQPPGANIIINHINGPAFGGTLGDPQIFGLNTVTNNLIRFDAKTGDVLQTIPLAGMGAPIGGVSMGRDDGTLVALVTNGSLIQAYNAVNGAFVGQFSTASLAPAGLTQIDGLGSTNTQTVVSDSSAGPLGLAQIIDVTASLATGEAVPVGAAYPPQCAFELSGGSTGLAGTDLIFLSGAGFFDTAQPDLTQIGLLVLNASGHTLSENARGALPGADSSFVDAGPAGTASSHPFQALGSIESNLALVTGNANGENNVTLYNPVTFAADGAVNLKDPNKLAGLGESFHPEIAGSALIDTTGEINSVRIQNAKGMVFNSDGAINYLQIARAVDSTVVARPLGNVAVGSRHNLTLLSTQRFFAGRNGVTVNPNLPIIGPLTLPS